VKYIPIHLNTLLSKQALKDVYPSSIRQVVKSF
jgi:hypothetical protein